MKQVVNIPLSAGRKAKVPVCTYQAIRRAIPIMECDRRVAAYVAAPHEGITPEIVAKVRERMIATGKVKPTAYSRRKERAA